MFPSGCMLIDMSRNGKLFFSSDVSNVNWRFGWRLLTTSNSSFVSHITVLTISLTYLRKSLVSNEWLMSVWSFSQQNEHIQNWFSILSNSVLLICWHFEWNHLLQTSHSTLLERSVTRCSQLRQVLDCVLVGVCNFSCGSHDFIQRFAKITAKDAPIANPSFITVPFFIAFQMDVGDGQFTQTFHCCSRYVWFIVPSIKRSQGNVNGFLYGNVGV